MYLSKIIINPANKSVVYNIDNSDFWHKKVMEGFMDYMEPISNIREKLGILFRLNLSDKEFVVYVQSKVEPNWYGLSWVKNANVKDMSNLLNSLYDGLVLNFEVLTLPYLVDENNKIRSIKGKENKINWFKEKLPYSGFEIYNDYLDTEFCREKFTNIGGNKNISFYATLFKGTLVITNVEKFKECYMCGIGRQKAYGAGMFLLS